MKEQPLQFFEIKSGMELWDNKEKRVQKVLRAWLWKDMIIREPDRYYKKKPKDTV